MCPRCGVSHQYIYKNNGSKGQYQCKFCGKLFNETIHHNKSIIFRCPYCRHTLATKKERKHFKVHKTIFYGSLHVITFCNAKSNFS
ncbi:MULTISPECIES: hypothetical protein [Clostridium]|uniref:hypothetical protein n=1 Tax=Clostridium TaxID=1485 RepID=UPI001403618A|nr:MULTISPECIES: hypothetical protein [Clostridium]